jgi:hypothetical protein
MVSTPIQTIKFSQFNPGGDLAPGESTAGLLSSANALFNNPAPLLAPGNTASRPAVTSAIYYRLRFNTDLQAYEYYSPVAAGWIQIQNSGSPALSWFAVSGTSALAVVEAGYVTQSSSQTTITLPAIAPLGSSVSVRGLGAGGWILQANAGQSIMIDGQLSSFGGGLISAGANDTVDVNCIVVNTVWQVYTTISSGLTTF